MIEIVSRANKASREHRDAFVAKSMEILRNRTHLVIVDVQPPSTPVPAGFHALICEAHGEPPAALPNDRRLQAASYQVLDDGAVRSHVVPLKTGDRLPEMPVFLEPHRFVRIPLDETYETAFGNLPSRFRRVLEAGSPESGPVAD